MHDYLSKRKLRVSVGSSLNEWLEIVLGIHQRSIYRSILFNIFINDLLVFKKERDICNFVDGTTLYKYGRGLDIASEHLMANIAINRLKNDEMVANLKKFQLTEAAIRGVLKKRCSENMQEICRIPMPKYELNKVAKGVI